MTLASTPTGSRVVLCSLPTDPVMHERLLALGFAVGTEVEVVRRAWPGGLLHLRRGLLSVMLRSETAAEIRVSPRTERV